MELGREIDLGKVDLDFGEYYQKGEKEGIVEAKERDHRDYFKEGVEYGRQWGLEFGYEMGFIDYLKDLMKQSEIKLLKNPKLLTLVGELQAILGSTTVENCSIEQINSHRDLANKKFKILLSLLNVKNQQKLPQTQSLDF